MNPPIIDAGPGWLALNKPAGVSVHNDPGKDALSLAQSCLENDPALRTICKVSASVSPSPAHRLDRETSGILLLALTKERASTLQQLMEQRKAQKTYRAILRGQLSETEGVWQAPLTDRAEGRKNPLGSKSEQKACETRFRKLRGNKYVSEVEVDLITGRQHQIRRHAVLARHEVIGDGRYGDPKFNKKIEQVYGIDRLLLHAEKLQFQLDDRTVSLRAPVPVEFDKIFADQMKKEHPRTP